MNSENTLGISRRMLDGFLGFEPSLDAISYQKIYALLRDIIPREETTFEDLGTERIIACELICSSICHNINWEFLRKAVLRDVMDHPEHTTPKGLSALKPVDVEKMLLGYWHQERIRAKERCELLQAIGTSVYNNEGCFSSIFFYKTRSPRHVKDVDARLNRIASYSSDPERKKLNLLYQTLSDYHGFEFLADAYRPTIDYHIIRMYLRRGVVSPANAQTYEYIFDDSVSRREGTVGALRNICANSLETISWMTRLNIKSANRIEWWVGRTICTNGNPDCDLRSDESSWLRDSFEKCPYFDTCYARQYNPKFLEINEPQYRGASY